MTVALAVASLTEVKFARMLFLHVQPSNEHVFMTAAYGVRYHASCPINVPRHEQNARGVCDPHHDKTLIVACPQHAHLCTCRCGPDVLVQDVHVGMRMG